MARLDRRTITCVGPCRGHCTYQGGVAAHHFPHIERNDQDDWPACERVGVRHHPTYREDHEAHPEGMREEFLCIKTIGKKHNAKLAKEAHALAQELAKAGVAMQARHWPKPSGTSFDILFFTNVQCIRELPVEVSNSGAQAPCSADVVCVEASQEPRAWHGHPEHSFAWRTGDDIVDGCRRLVSA